MTSHDENRLVEFWTVLSDEARYLFGSVFCKVGVSFPVSCRLMNRNGKYEERKNQQDATIRCLLTSVSTCFGHHYAHLQENKRLVIAFGVLFWFCWMWLVAVVGCCLVGCEH